MGDHDVPIVSVPTADLFSQVRQRAGLPGPQQEFGRTEYPGTEIQLVTADFGVCDLFAKSIDLSGGNNVLTGTFTPDSGYLSERLQRDLAGRQRGSDIRLINTAEPAVVVSVLLLKVECRPWNLACLFLLHVIERVCAAAVVDAVTGRPRILPAHSGVLEPRCLFEPVHVAITDSQHFLSTFDVRSQKDSRVDIREGRLNLSRGRDRSNGRVDHRPATDRRSAEHRVRTMDNLFAYPGLHRLRRWRVLGHVFDRNTSERRHQARRDGREPARAVVRRQHPREAFAVYVRGVPQPAPFQDQGFDAGLAEPQCRYSAAIAASNHDGPVVKSWSG